MQIFQGFRFSNHLRFCYSYVWCCGSFLKFLSFVLRFPPNYGMHKLSYDRKLLIQNGAQPAVFSIRLLIDMKSGHVLPSSVLTILDIILLI